MEIFMYLWILITMLGNSNAYLFLIPFVYFLIDRELGWRVLLLTVLTAIIVDFLKDFFRFPRPPEKFWKIKVHGFGFPSGHATGASAFWSYLSLKLRNKILYIVSALLIFLISISRIILGVHYLRDVIGGIVIGLGVSIAFYYFDKNIKKIGKKKKDESLLGGVILILLASPFLLPKIPLVGSAFLGFGIAHIVVYFLKFEEVKDMKKKAVNFLISIGTLSLVFVFQNSFFAVLLGFFSCFLPQVFWNYEKLKRTKTL